MTISLELSNIQLHGSAANKADAIRQVGGLLVNSGTIQPGYIDSMFGREKVAITYLGNGISIPHGLPKDRALINKTGIAVLQTPQGVTWNPGETVRLVVGIAAKSDEHLQTLANLVHVLNDEALVEEIGIMIEVPSAVIMADGLAEEVHFFSIGTNDLTQYVLAMDRVHPVLARQADGLHPAVLRMVGRTVQAANAAGRWVGVCGGIAGDPRGAVVLVGLGVQELSVSIPSVAAVKAQMRRVALADMDALAKRALACRTAAEVRALPLP